MRLNAYLNFGGNCEEAFRHYERVLGGQITGIHRFRGTPGEEHVAPEWLDKVMHVELKVADQVLMGSDNPYDAGEKMQGMYVSVNVTDVAEAERIFGALEEGGEVKMPLEKTFWAERFGMVVDRFGTPWMVNGGPMD